MGKQRITFLDILKNQSKKRLVLSVLLVAVFIALILIYNILLLNSINENIVSRGQSAAERAAVEFDDFLSDCSNAIIFAEYTLDNLIMSGSSGDEIQTFMTQQTETMKHSIGQQTTVLYAYIDGKIYDGTGWVPDPDYVPESRPWYIKAMADKGSFVFCDPYVDARTGNVLMTISKTMSDGESVVALDVSMEYIQNVTKQQSENNINLTEMVLDSGAGVVAHSDERELGKNYHEESGSIGSVIAQELTSGTEQHFNFSFGNHGYIAYIVPIHGGWYSVSVVATASEYIPLRVLFVISVLASVFTITALIVIMIRSGSREIVAGRLNSQLSSAADIYMSLSDIDLKNETIIQIKDTDPEYIDQLIPDHEKNVQKTFRTLMEMLPDNPTKQSAKDFIELGTLNDRLKNVNNVSLEYMSFDNKWVRGRFVVSEREADGSVSHVLWMLEDIDKEKKIRDKLTEKTNKLTAQLSSAADIYISLCDLDVKDNSVTAIKNANPAIAKAVDACDHNMQEIFFDIMRGLPEGPTKQAAIDFCDLSDIDEKLAETNTVTVEYLSYGNIWVRGRYVVSERDRKGRITHVLWMLENIDAEKRARDRLSAVAEKLHNQMSSIANIYMSAYDFDLTNDTFSEVRASNRQVTGIIGENRSNAQQTLYTVMDRMADDSSIAAVREFVDLSTLGERLNGTNTITIEYFSKDGMWRRGRFIESGRNENGELDHVLWVVEDIDKEKKDREKLIDMSERAVAANEAKSAFLSNMSHEIRTPINAVLGMNEMVLRESSDPAVITYSESIRTAGTTLLGLINDILDFSKIEAGKMEIIPVDYDLATVLSDLVNMIQTRLDNKGLMLVTEFDKSMPHLLHGDEVRIKQVITNILTNAVKYTEKGSVTFSVTYEKIPDEPDSVMLKVAIKDTGIGIKQEDMAKLFSKFERIEEERNRTIEGTGLGMSITQSLLSMMNSRLEVDSIYGEGSTFGFSLKQDVRKWDELGDYAEAYKRSITSRKKYHEKFTAPDAHILVVDDTVMNLLVFTSLLKSTQVKIDTAESGDDGILLALKNKYDIIFLDHMMPHKDGIETLKELKAAESNPNRDTPMICLTANAISGAREQYLDAGFDDYLTKPIESAKLEEMICEYLPPDKIKAAAVLKPKAAPKAVLPDAIFDIVELDAVAGINNAGSEEMYLELLKSYAGMMGKYLDDLADYWLCGNVANAVIMLHSLKGASRTVGAGQIQRYAKRLEDAGNAGDTDTLNAEMDNFLFRCRILGAAISSVLETVGGSAGDTAESGTKS